MIYERSSYLYMLLVIDPRTIYKNPERTEYEEKYEKFGKHNENYLDIIKKCHSPEKRGISQVCLRIQGRCSVRVGMTKEKNDYMPIPSSSIISTGFRETEAGVWADAIFGPEYAR